MSSSSNHWLTALNLTTLDDTMMMWGGTRLTTGH